MGDSRPKMFRTRTTTLPNLGQTFLSFVFSAKHIRQHHVLLVATPNNRSLSIYQTLNSETANMSSPTWFRITLMRSAIGLPKRTRGILSALGLNKRMRVVYQPVSRDVAGMILKVKELLDVEEVEKHMTREEIRASRKPDPGFYIESRAEPPPSPPAQ